MTNNRYGVHIILSALSRNTITDQNGARHRNQRKKVTLKYMYEYDPNITRQTGEITDTLIKRRILIYLGKPNLKGFVEVYVTTSFYRNL